MTDTPEIPHGFKPHFRKSPVTDAWEPLYSRVHAGTVQIGLFIDEQHCNGRGFLHGGVIASLCDNAMGLTYSLNLDGPTGIVTVNLSVDYVSTARKGDWLLIAPRLVRAGKSMGFVDALVSGGEKTVARASATFRNL